MIIRATFDEQGFVAGFYPDDVWPENFPLDAIEISKEQYIDLLENQGLRRWDGEKVVEYTPPQPPPSYLPLTARQLRLGLVSNGILLSQVEATIDAMENQQDRDVARIEWEYASVFERDHPLIEQVGGALGLGSEKIDSMWLAASSL